MTQDKNWPQLSEARIDEMVDTATAFPQERAQVFIWWSRPALAVAASVILLIAVVAGFQTPRYSMPHAENITATDNGDLSDYMMYEILDDLI